MATIDDFIKEHGLTMTAQRIPARTDRAADQWSKDAFHYLATIKNKDGGEHSLAYSMGSGHVEPVPFVFGRFIVHGERATRKDYDRVSAPRFKPRTLFDKELHEQVVRPKQPDLATVLGCLASDCAGYENARSFEDWASEYGYDTDSRKAFATYEQVREQHEAMERLLGRAALQRLMFDTDRL